MEQIDTSNEDTLNIKEIFFKVIVYWPVLLFCLIFALSIAYFINQNTTPIYEVKTSILVKQEQSMLGSQFGGLMNTNSFQIQNEIAIIKSSLLCHRTINRLDFSIGYFQEGLIDVKELYVNSPFLVKLDSGCSIPVNCKFYLKFISDSSFSIEIDQKQISKLNFQTNILSKSTNEKPLKVTAKLFEDLKSKGLPFRIIPNTSLNCEEIKNTNYSFIIYSDNGRSQIGGLNVFEVKAASILWISVKGQNTTKMCDFLNTFTEVYLEKGIEKKNQMAENTIHFIDSQLDYVSDSLSVSENLLQNFRSENRLMDVNTQTQQVFATIESLQEKRAEIIVREKYFDYLLKYLNDTNDGKNLVSPISLGIEDQSLNSFINEIGELYSERTELAVNSIRDNPYLITNQQKIKQKIQSTIDNIKNLKKASEITINELDKRIDEVSSKVNKLPAKQMKLINFERKYKLNDALYTYLLTKRSETQIAKASYFPDNEVLDIAKPSEARRISPDTNRNYMMAVLFGLGIPLVLIVLRDFFSSKIQYNKDIESVTKTPIIGHVIHNTDKLHTVCFDFPLSITSESIRTIRTNLQFVATEKKKHKILVTSSGMGEGKTFFSLNLAISYAMFNKKVVLLNFDLRKPKLHEYLFMDNSKGLSLYLCGNNELDDNIQATRIPNLDVIFAGVVPPNPMELIAGDNTAKLFEELEKRYDYIVIDSPPVGMVADSLLLSKYADVNLFIVRQNKTNKRIFGQVIQNLKTKDIPNLNIVLNDVKQSGRYSAYGYHYGYTYGYKIEKKTFWNRFWRTKS